jgi:anionic cell wall polymer biosynthesis LytR-Cps2A-Psr (LCP) family protein
MHLRGDNIWGTTVNEPRRMHARSESPPAVSGSPGSHGVIPARHGRLKRPSPLAVAMKFLALALAVVLVSSVAIAGIAVLQLQSNLQTVDLVGDAASAAGASLPSIDSYDGGYTFLIVGSDTRKGQGIPGDTTVALNDVNLLLHVSADHTSAVAVSIPRDLVVPIPSCPDPAGGSFSAMAGQPINVTLTYGGLPCTVLTV